MWPFSPNRNEDDSLSAEARRWADEELRRIAGMLASRDDLVAASIATAEARRAQADRLLWEIPALGLTAQAFLSTISLDPAATNWARFVASFIALLFVGAAFQSLLKHRYHEGMWARWLELVEDRLSLPRHNPSSKVLTVARTSSGSDLQRPWRLYQAPFYLLKPYGFGKHLFRESAFRVWATSLVAVMAIDALMVLIALVGIASGLESPFAKSTPQPSATHPTMNHSAPFYPRAAQGLREPLTQ